MDKRQIQALILSFSGTKMTQIAAEVGVTERTIQAWKNKPDWKDLESLMAESIVADSAEEISGTIRKLVRQSFYFLEKVLTSDSEEINIKHKLQASGQVLSLLRYQIPWQFEDKEEKKSGLSHDTIDIIRKEILGIENENT